MPDNCRKFRGSETGMKANYLIIVGGPTAAGKTGIAITLAKHLGTEIINADSRQVYREMVIGTAVPTDAELKEVKHHMLGHLSVQDTFNASSFEQEVITLLDRWYIHNHTMVMVGGSGMYIDAVCKGIDDLPSVDPLVRKKIHEEYESGGIGHLRDRLRVADPEYFQKVDVNNPHRIMKALEITEMTGRSYTSFLTGRAKPRNFIPIKIGLDLPRPELHERINRRVDSMMSNGLLDEVRLLYNLRHVNALNTVGYKELFDFINGTCSLDEAVEKIKSHTRQYARRQLTWFHRDKSFRWFHPSEINAIISFVDSEIF